jgi:hypothetical protein
MLLSTSFFYSVNDAVPEARLKKLRLLLRHCVDRSMNSADHRVSSECREILLLLDNGLCLSARYLLVEKATLGCLPNFENNQICLFSKHVDVSMPLLLYIC